jgi:RNA polymerase sigma factor (sigma-70 family)
LPSQLSDSALVAACLRGNGGAWQDLVDRYQGLVYSIPTRAGLSADDTAEVFQGVFALLLEHLGSIKEPQALAAWLITTTRREVWRLLRRRARESAEGDMAEAIQAADRWRQGSAAEETLWADQVLVHEALGLVGERCRRLLELLYLDGASPTYEEISARLRMPVGSIGPTRARCLEKMRGILRRMGMEES